MSPENLSSSSVMEKWIGKTSDTDSNSAIPSTSQGVEQKGSSSQTLDDVVEICDSEDVNTVTKNKKQGKRLIAKRRLRRN